MYTAAPGRAGAGSPERRASSARARYYSLSSSSMRPSGPGATRLATIVADCQPPSSNSSLLVTGVSSREKLAGLPSQCGPTYYLLKQQRVLILWLLPLLLLLSSWTLPCSAFVITSRPTGQPSPPSFLSYASVLTRQPHHHHQRRAAVAAADVQESSGSTTTAAGGSSSSVGGMMMSKAATERQINELVAQIKRNAGTPAVIEPLREAVKLTGTGEIRKEFFKAIFPFELDDFQLSALEALGSRQNTIVSAPTGSGKTVAGELAIYYAIAMGLKVFYTTPLKALSNQKFLDFGEQFGVERVALLTGDTNINRGAQVTIMTTEVFRNMLYAGDTGELDELFAVVFDEFHYMNDPERGTVWEESVILAPPHVLFVALSATIANVGQVAGWINNVHGPTRMVVSDFRPVPLRYYFADSEGMYKLFEHEDAGPGARMGLKKFTRPKGMVPLQQQAINKGKKAKKGKLSGGDAEAMVKAAAEQQSSSSLMMMETMQPVHDLLKKRALRERRLLLENTVGYRGSGRLSRPPDGARFTAGYRDVVEALKRRDLLPAIIFLFSRNGCDRAAAEIGGVASKLGLLTSQEKQIVKEKIQAFRASNPQVPLEKERARLLLQGIASHHAGLLPVYKTLVEDLFNANLIKVVFATETLAAGVNMPARCTVITSLSKKLGRTVVKLMPSQLLQMAGRAGRRGKDEQGHVVLMRSRQEDALDAYDLIISPVDSIRSHFRSSYAMVVNMLRTRSLESCRVLVDKSFGSYLKVYDLGDSLKEDEAHIESLRARLGEVDRGELKLAQQLEEKLVKAQRAAKEMRREADKIERRFVNAVLGPARMGAGLLLKDGQTAALVGETLLPNPLTGNTNIALTVVLCQSGEVMAIEGGEVRNVDVDQGRGLEVEVAFQIGALVTGGGSTGLSWRPLKGSAVRYRAEPRDPESEEAQGLLAYLSEVGQGIREVKTLPVPEELSRQEDLVKQLQQQLQACPARGTTNLMETDELLLQLSQLERLEKRAKRKRRQLEGAQEKEWNDFKAATTVLSTYGALDAEDKPTPLGLLVGDVRSENELWAAMVLLSDGLADLEGVDLVGVLSALVNDISKPDIRMQFTASQPAQEHLSRLFPARAELLQSQGENGLDFPCPFETSLADSHSAGRYAGFTWRELVDTTSLDQGDVCRHLRRVIDLLRQIPVLPRGLVPERLKNTARDAADRMDRFPVADDLIVRSIGNAPGAAEAAQVDMVEDDDEDEIEVDMYDLVKDDVQQQEAAKQGGGEEEGTLLSELYKISRQQGGGGGGGSGRGGGWWRRDACVEEAGGEDDQGRAEEGQGQGKEGCHRCCHCCSGRHHLARGREEEEDMEDDDNVDFERMLMMDEEQDEDEVATSVEGFLAALDGWAAAEGPASSDDDDEEKEDKRIAAATAAADDEEDHLDEEE